MSTTTRRIVAPLVAIGLLVATAFFASPASAYNGLAPSVSISDTTPTPGENVSGTLSNFNPNTSGTITLHSVGVPLGTFTTDASGSATYSVTIPSDTALGSHELWFDDAATTVDPDVSIPITVVSGSGGGGLAGTGVAVVGIGALGIVLLIGGGLMLLAGRRRKTAI